MQQQRGHADAFGHQAGQHLGGERPTGAGHLGRARLGGVHVLVGRDRIAAPHVAVADGAAVAGQVAVQRFGRVDLRDPQPHAVPAGTGGVGGEEVDPAAARSSTMSPGLRPPGRRGAVPADLDRPQPGRQLRRQVDLDGRAVGSVPSTSAASVPDVLMTTRSPSSRKRGSSEKCECTSGRRAWRPPACARHHGSCPGPRAARAPRARVAGEGEGVQFGQACRSVRPSARSCPSPPLRSPEFGGAVAPARAVARR